MSSVVPYHIHDDECWRTDLACAIDTIEVLEVAMNAGYEYAQAYRQECADLKRLLAETGALLRTCQDELDALQQARLNL